MATIVRVTIDCRGDIQMIKDFFELDENDGDQINGNLLQCEVCVRFVAKLSDERELVENLKTLAKELTDGGLGYEFKVEQGEMASPTKFLVHKTIFSLRNELRKRVRR